MCSTCGCHQPEEAVTITLVGSNSSLPNPRFEDAHSFGLLAAQEPVVSQQAGNGHHHQHHPEHAAPAAIPPAAPTRTVIELEQDILHQNNLLAERNRGYFEALNIRALNLVSSPGSGKTTLLERTLHDLAGEFSCYVIEGDQQTSRDADRIAATGAPVVQINTGKGCHLDSAMVSKAVKSLQPQAGALLFIENVGNLVCPAMFDLGEGARVVVISVTEGDDKPLKYPDMFHSAQLCIINKIDLLPYVPFDLERCREYAGRVNPRLAFIELSAYTGQGMEQWYEWLREGR